MSLDYARTVPGRRTAVGDVDRSRLNVNGGSLAFGHPFGGIGAAMVLESE